MPNLQQWLPLTPQQFQILLSLTTGERHGYAVILDVEARTAGQLRMGTGTLYTALARLLALQLIAETDRRDERRRFYKLTALGRRVLSAEAGRLESLVAQARARGVRPIPASPTTAGAVS
jgi:DNA-binding PadR family transcriptional regulator